MAESREHTFPGVRGVNTVREWLHDQPRYVVILIHGHGEHIGRHEHVADRPVRHGAAVYGMDHVGHGKSEGHRALIEDFGDVVTDVHAVEERARRDHPGVPLVVIGHSMGGMIAARYAQLHGIGLAALVLSGPVIGEWRSCPRCSPSTRSPASPSTLPCCPAIRPWERRPPPTRWCGGRSSDPRWTRSPRR